MKNPKSNILVNGKLAVTMSGWYGAYMTEAHVTGTQATTGLLRWEGEATAAGQGVTVVGFSASEQVFPGVWFEKA